MYITAPNFQFKLYILATIVDLLWILIGNINAILFSSNKFGGWEVSNSFGLLFREFINHIRGIEDHAQGLTLFDLMFEIANTYEGNFLSCSMLP